MKKWSYYLVVELPKSFSEEETNSLKWSIKEHIDNTVFGLNKPIEVKKVTYTTNYEN